MRSARGAYAQAIRAQLQLLGIDDLPRNGAFILAGIDTSGGPRADLPSELGVTKQAVSQVIDVLVNRGYLERHGDPGDRRRVVLELTDRGREVVQAVQRGVEAVDRRLEERVPPEQVDAMRSALIALSTIKSEGITTGAGRRRSARQLRRFSPIFDVRDLRAALSPLRDPRLRDLRLRRRRCVRFRPPRRGRAAPGGRSWARPAGLGGGLSLRARRRRALPAMEPARCRRPHPPGRTYSLPAARGLACRPGR